MKWPKYIVASLTWDYITFAGTAKDVYELNIPLKYICKTTTWTTMLENITFLMYLVIAPVYRIVATYINRFA